jgi:glycerophosphoryl diester phosphodiesterase
MSAAGIAQQRGIAPRRGSAKAALANPVARGGPQSGWPGGDIATAAGKLAPENTLAAMRVGYAHGYRMVEFDVKLSGDGVPFLLHDDTLDRTTDGRGRADALTWAELAKLDAGSWHSAVYAGEMLPTLGAIARWSIANGVACNIEIKPSPGRESATGAAVALDARALWRGTPIAPLMSSFSEAALAEAMAVAPELPRALLFEKVPPDWPERLARLQCVALDTDYREIDAVSVAACPRCRLQDAHTPNDPRKRPSWCAGVSAASSPTRSTRSGQLEPATALHDGCVLASVRYAQPLARFTALSHPAVNSAARSRVIAGSKRRSTRQFARMSSVFFQ